MLNGIRIVARKSRCMDQLVREATEIVLHFKSVNMKDSVFLSRLKSCHSLTEGKEAKRILQKWNSLALLRHSYLIPITDADMNKAYYSPPPSDKPVACNVISHKLVLYKGPFISVQALSLHWLFMKSILSPFCGCD
jgi:hypothetical protein